MRLSTLLFYVVSCIWSINFPSLCSLLLLISTNVTCCCILCCGVSYSLSLSTSLLTLLPLLFSFSPCLSVVRLYRCNSRCLVVVVELTFCMMDTRLTSLCSFALFRLLSPTGSFLHPPARPRLGTSWPKQLR